MEGENNKNIFYINTETKRENIKLTPEIVDTMFRNALYKGESERIYSRLPFNSYEKFIFNKELLADEEFITTLEQLAHKLPAKFFNKDTGGADYNDARFDINNEQWVRRNGVEHRKLLTLIVTYGMGRVTTGEVLSRHSRCRDKRSYFVLIDTEKAQKERLYNEYIHGKKF